MILPMGFNGEDIICKINLIFDQLGVVLTLLLIVVPIITLIVILVLPPDFEYNIKVEKHYLIFEISEDNKWCIKRPFTIRQKNKAHIIIDDGFSRMSIAYNNELLEFLKEINN